MAAKSNMKQYGDVCACMYVGGGGTSGTRVRIQNRALIKPPVYKGECAWQYIVPGGCACPLYEQCFVFSLSIFFRLRSRYTLFMRVTRKHHFLIAGTASTIF